MGPDLRREKWKVKLSNKRIVVINVQREWSEIVIEASPSVASAGVGPEMESWERKRQVFIFFSLCQMQTEMKKRNRKSEMIEWNNFRPGNRARTSGMCCFPFLVISKNPSYLTSQLLCLNLCLFGFMWISVSEALVWTYKYIFGFLCLCAAVYTVPPFGWSSWLVWW